MNVKLEKMNPFGYCIATQSCCHDIHLLGFIPPQEIIWNFVAWEIIRQCGTRQHFSWIFLRVGLRQSGNQNFLMLHWNHIVLFHLGVSTLLSAAGLACICWCRTWQVRFKICFLVLLLLFLLPFLFSKREPGAVPPSSENQLGRGIWGGGKSPKSLGTEGQLSVPGVLLSPSADGLCRGFRQGKVNKQRCHSFV